MAINSADAATAEFYRKDLAFCNIQLVGFGPGNIDVVDAKDLRNGFTIQTSDPSYKLVSFELKLDVIERQYSTFLTSPVIAPDIDDVTRRLADLKPGMVKASW